MVWPTASAVVVELSVRPIGENKYGNIRMGLRYSTRLGDRHTWVYVSLMRWRGEKFVHDYAVGTHHVIRVNPSRPAEGALPSDDYPGVLLILPFAMCAGLLLAARYFWRHAADPG